MRVEQLTAPKALWERHNLFICFIKSAAIICLGDDALQTIFTSKFRYNAEKRCLKTLMRKKEQKQFAVPPDGGP